MSGEHDLERKVTEWLGDGPVIAPHAPVEAALQHAAAHTRRPSLVLRLRRLLARLLRITVPSTTAGPLTEGPQAVPARGGLTLAAMQFAAVVLIVALAGFVVLEGPLRQRGASAPGPAATIGLPGSLWLDGSAGIPVHYLVHPDGTLVALGGNGSVGLGLWEPAGERSLVSMLVYPDADPSPDVRLGTAIHLAEWIVDAAGESATVTYVATFERADGTPVPEQAGAFTLQRLHSPTQPGDAGIAAPPEPAWRTELGLPLHGVGRGGIRVVAGEPWDYDVTHADGTLLTLSPPCDRVGLWSPTGERASVRTDWALTAGSASEPQEVGWMLPGPGMAMAIEPLDRERAIAAPDPSSWPSLGTIWVEATADGLAVRSAYFADGTVISVHPVYGTGVGLWQPAGDDTFASTIHYRKGRTRLSGESTVSPDGETISTRYRLVDDRAGAPPEEGVSKATRMHLEVSADPVSPAP